MCLIYTGPANKIRNLILTNREFVESVFDYNSDGFGVMWANRRGLKVVKTLPKSVDEIIAIASTLPDDDRMMAVHHRLTTHGKTDMTNCHPYTVVENELAMMHNGILSTGNDADPSKSDTWHFIQDYLAEPLSQAPSVAHTKGFIEMCGEFIGNNRFVFMDKHGKLSVVNADQGIEHGGVWFANTYAWEPSTFIPTYRKRVTSLVSYGGYDGYRGWTSRKGDQYSAATRSVVADPKWDNAFDEDMFLAAVDNCDAESAGWSFLHYPVTSAKTLLSTYRATLTSSVRLSMDKAGSLGDVLKGTALAAVEACLAADRDALSAAATAQPKAVADAVCYYLDWDAIDGAEEDEDEDQPTARFMGYSIYVTQTSPHKYGYQTFDRHGQEFDWMDDFSTPEMALEEAMDTVRSDHRYGIQDTVDAIEDSLDLQMAEALARQREEV